MAGIQTGLVAGVKVPGIEAGFAEADLDGNLGNVCFGNDGVGFERNIQGKNPCSERRNK